MRQLIIQKTSFYLLLALCAGNILANTASAQPHYQYIKISTGNLNGSYYSIGASICNILNKHSEELGVKCVARPSSGSVANVESLTENISQLAIIQSDTLFHSYKNLNNFKKEKYNKIRAILPLYNEKFTYIVRKDSNINDIKSLRGKAINIGSRNSGTRNAFLALQRVNDWTTKDFSDLRTFSLSSQGGALCANKVDAISYVIGHPNAAIHELRKLCEIKVLPFEGKLVDNYLLNRPYLFKSIIPANLYPEIKQDIPTIATRATLAAINSTNEDLIYKVVKLIDEHFEDLKNTNPMMDFNKDEININTSLTAYHKGALRYFKEIGKH